MIAFNFSFITFIVLVILVIFGVKTKKWDKAGYILSAYLFLMSIIIAATRISNNSLGDLGITLAIMSSGLLIMSLSHLASKKK